ncbi:DUF2262 domain-containing protein [Myroides sp. N17-2]|uniref:DUF2262 domain-containing protein n=1 Tax=Myroides sp. N17-2 TaxID=2030799 RepID=UPI000EFCC4C6|nr:DUF2262 domain-containing protein [Myroides sp. N17-2]
MNNNLDTFLKDFTLRGDGTGDYDAYEKTEKWIVDQTVNISLVKRVLTEETTLTLKSILENKIDYDKLWKEFVATNLLDTLKNEWEDENLTPTQVLNELRIVDIAFNFYNQPVEFYVYLITKNVDAEHGVVILCDKNKIPLKTFCE